MKKVILTFVAVLGIVAFLNAQELTSKKGFTILPEAGDWSISMDATPFLDFALNTVNIMNNTGQTSAHPSYVGGFNANVVGKYFVESDMAYRVKFGINTGSTKNTMFFDDPADVFANPTETTWAEVSDVAKTSTMNILIGGGLEFRRGHNRLQGYYGGDVMIGIQTNKATNEWAVEQNQAAADNFYTNNDGSLVTAARTLTNKTGTGIGFGVRGFIGAEYFFAPKMSIGAEFGWGLGIQSAGRSEIVSEAWTGTESEETTTQGDKSSNFGFAVDNGMGNLFGASAALLLNLHF